MKMKRKKIRGAERNRSRCGISYCIPGLVISYTSEQRTEFHPAFSNSAQLLSRIISELILKQRYLPMNGTIKAHFGFPKALSNHHKLRDLITATCERHWAVSRPSLYSEKPYVPRSECWLQRIRSICVTSRPV
jgi:hypothetical protein